MLLTLIASCRAREATVMVLEIHKTLEQLAWSASRREILNTSIDI